MSNDDSTFDVEEEQSSRNIGSLNSSQFKYSILKWGRVWFAQRIPFLFQNLHQTNHFRIHLGLKRVKKFLCWSSAIFCIVKLYLKLLLLYSCLLKRCQLPFVLYEIYLNFASTVFYSWEATLRKQRRGPGFFFRYDCLPIIRSARIAYHRVGKVGIAYHKMKSDADIPAQTGTGRVQTVLTHEVSKILPVNTRKPGLFLQSGRHLYEDKPL